MSLAPKTGAADPDAPGPEPIPSPEIDPANTPEEAPQTDPVPVAPGDWRPHD